MTSKPLNRERLNLENTAEKLISLALGAGADRAEVAATFEQRTRISLEKQDYHLASADSGYSFGLRVLKGQQMGFCYVNCTDPKELKRVASKAVEIASLSPPNPYFSIAPTENVSQQAPEDMFDPSLYNLSVRTQKDWIKIMVDEARRDKRFRINEGGLEISSRIFLIMSSLGTHKLEKETTVGWSLMGMGVDGDRITSFDYFQEISRKASKVPDRIHHSTHSFCKNVLQSLNQGPAETYRGLVVFSPRAVVEVLLSALVYHMNGRNVIEGITKWKITDVGQELFHRDLSLWDKPWLTDRAGCAAFDREGVPTKSQALIQKGVLKLILLDQYSGRALERPSTGHAAGGPSSLPTVAPHCLYLEPGPETLNSLMARSSAHQKKLLVVNRYSGQVDPVTGDFSGVAKGGEWWSSGKREYFVQETLISGNLFEALNRSMWGISKETEVVHSEEECPTIVLDNVSVTSGGNP